MAGTKKGRKEAPSGIAISEAEDCLGELVNRVEHHREEITITRGKKRRPVAKLVPIDSAA